MEVHEVQFMIGISRILGAPKSSTLGQHFQIRGGYVGYIYHVWLVVSTVCIYPSCFGMILNREYPPKLPFCDGDKDDKPWVT